MYTQKPGCTFLLLSCTVAKGSQVHCTTIDFRATYVYGSNPIIYGTTTYTCTSKTEMYNQAFVHYTIIYITCVIDTLIHNYS